jgi:hypothetical protein
MTGAGVRSEASFGSQNDDRAWGVRYRREEFCFAFCGQKDSMQRILIKICFLFTVGSVCRVKWFTTGSRNGHIVGKRFGDDQEVETEVQYSQKYFYAAGLHALVKRWNKCINVGGGYVKKYMFFRVRISHVLYPFMTYLLIIPLIILRF